MDLKKHIQIIANSIHFNEMQLELIVPFELKLEKVKKNQQKYYVMGHQQHCTWKEEILCIDNKCTITGGG